MKLKLKQIDLSKGHEHQHPDIKVGKTEYIALFDGQLYLGNFSREWYGLSFTDFQFDAPGYNSSYWQGLWEIVKTK